MDRCRRRVACLTACGVLPAPPCSCLPACPPAPAGGQGSIDPEDVAEAVLLAFRCSPNCVPEEIILKAASPNGSVS